MARSRFSTNCGVLNGSFYCPSGMLANWDTRNLTVGSSLVNQVQLPFTLNGTYNCEVDWGDGTSDLITVWNQAETLHTYAVNGIYPITITGPCSGFRFNNGGDRAKILDIFSWGSEFELIDFGAFYNCANLDILASDFPQISTGSFLNMFRGCVLLTTPDLNNWPVSNVTSFDDCFHSCVLFNGLVNLWDMSSATSFVRMFNWAVLFDQNIGGWKVTALLDATSMFASAGMSTANYGLLLVGWNGQTVQSTVPFDGGASTYSTGAPTAARTNLMTVDLWPIIDGGPA